jgi:hypothetical protein
MADQDPYAATAIKPGKKAAKATAPASDPYAATAVQTAMPPPIVVPPATTPPQEGFLASAAAPFVDTAKALIPHSWKELGRRVTPGLAQYDAIKNIFVKPAIEQGKQAIDEFKQANAETPWYSMHPSLDAVNHRELALGHGLAAVIPGVGPWAAQIGQKEGEQFGAGNYPGAAGTAFGNALLALTPEIAGKIPKISETLARAATDTGAGPVKRLVKDTQAANKPIDIANTEVQSHNQASEQTLALRRQHEQAYQQATAEHYAKEAVADARAKAEENAAWGQWRQKTAGKTLDGGQITGPLQKLRLDSPEVDRTLNQLEPRGDEVPQESPYAQIREQASQQQFGKDYESLSPVKQDQIDDLLHTSGHSPEPIAFDPQAGQPISIDRVQRASSILQRYIRSGRFEGPLLGEMKQVAKVLHNAVTRASTDAGAGADLSAARNSTVTYQGAFGRERRTPVTARTVREQQANPEAFRERANEERLTRARRYDPTLVDSYRQVKAAKDALKKFPSEEQLRKGLKQTTPRQTISAGDIAAARKIAADASAGKWWTRGRWAAASPIIWAMRDFFGGHIPNIGAIGTMGLGSAGILAGTHAVSNLLRYPPMIDFLSKARPEDLASIPPDLRGDLPGLVTLARRQGIKVAPALVAATAGAAKRPSQQVQQPVVQGAIQ